MADTTTVYTTGVFDMLHPGHLSILRRARVLGDRLVVGVQEDDSVEAQKGARPIMTTRERMTMLRALPFVDQVIAYSNLDQRPLLKAIRPQIMVQGGDWPTSADRSKIVAYAERHGIRIVVLPYTRGISSTAIKERVFQSLHEARREKQLEYDLTSRLALVPLRRLYTFEANDEARTARLTARIKSTALLLDPLTVGDIGHGRSLVIDGANRFEALRRLGARYAAVQRISYLDWREVQLRGNEHYLDVDPAAFLSLVARAAVPLRGPRAPASGSERFTADTLAMVYAGSDVYSVPASGSWMRDVDRLNALVRAYKQRVPCRRKSEVGNLIGHARVLVKFRAFPPSDIVVLVSKRMQLETGITWHIPETTVMRLEVPLEALTQGFATQRDARRYLDRLLQDRETRHSIRRYLSNVYVCNEWE